MAVDPETFRTKPWPERLTIFNAMSPDEKASLVRGCIASWLAAHRAELSGGQAEMLEEAIAFVTPGLYVADPDPMLLARLRDLETRTAAVLSRAQMRDALTMHWDPPATH